MKFREEKEILKGEKNKEEGKTRKFFKKLARHALIPVAAAMLTFSPVAKDINPFYSKPALAEEVPTGSTGSTSTAGNTNTAKADNANRLKDLALGGKLIGNEAGVSIAATMNYGMWGGADIGVMMFGERESPYFVLSLTPGLEKKGVKFRYFGKLAFVQLNSWIYTSHSLSLGYGKQFKNWGFNLGVIAGGALSYPTYDNIYFNMAGGVSFNIKETLYLYALAKSYFAAGNAMRTAYVGYYGPKFQGVEAGILVKIKELTGKVYWDHDVVQSKGGLILGTQFNITKKIKGGISGGIGVTHMTEELGGRTNFMAQAFLNLIYVGDSGITQSYKASYERYQKGGIPLQTDINSPPQLSPLSSQERAWENEAKQNLIESGNMDEFVSTNSGASKEEIITNARWLSRSLAEVAYANNAESALMQLKFFDPSVKYIANASHEEILDFLRKYLEWQQTHGSYEGMPDYLLNGIAVCAGIHSLTAMYLIKNGIGAAAFSVNAPQGPHVVAGYWTENETGIIDYGDKFVGPANSLDEVIRAYGEFRGAPTYVTQIFIPKKDDSWNYVGTWITPEGRLLNNSLGFDNFHLMRAYLLGIPGF
ncbi:hypothetical protein H0O02_04090 [Candidatus Micrarchaeota archaeon]|nr:hypothetical protein [Candidatus Micrarchaeota archaeon]